MSVNSRCRYSLSRNGGNGLPQYVLVLSKIRYLLQSASRTSSVLESVSYVERIESGANGNRFAEATCYRGIHKRQGSSGTIVYLNVRTHPLSCVWFDDSGGLRKRLSSTTKDDIERDLEIPEMALARSDPADKEISDRC